MFLHLNYSLKQSDREKAEGLPVAPFMDREKVTKPTAQIGFIKFVLIPMFETVMKVNWLGPENTMRGLQAEIKLRFRSNQV